MAAEAPKRECRSEESEDASESGSSEDSGSEADVEEITPENFLAEVEALFALAPGETSKKQQIHDYCAALSFLFKNLNKLFGPLIQRDYDTENTCMVKLQRIAQELEMTLLELEEEAMLESLNLVKASMEGKRLVTSAVAKRRRL